MLTRRESGGKLPACLDLRFLQKVTDKNQSKSIFHLERIQVLFEKKQYQNTHLGEIHILLSNEEVHKGKLFLELHLTL